LSVVKSIHKNGFKESTSLFWYCAPPIGRIGYQ